MLVAFSFYLIIMAGDDSGDTSLTYETTLSNGASISFNN